MSTRLMSKFVPTKEKHKRRLIKERNAAAEGLIRYVQHRIQGSEDFPGPVSGPYFDCTDCFMEHILDTGERLELSSIKVAELLMHGILALRIPLKARAIKRWKTVSAKWRRYRAQHRNGD